jgi:biotin carboxylase
MNVELVVDKNNNIYPIDIGPRSGGNMIPDLLGYIFAVDIVEWSIKSAMGEGISIDKTLPKSFYATHNLHSDKYVENLLLYVSKEYQLLSIQIQDN